VNPIVNIEFRWRRFGGLYRELEYRVQRAVKVSCESAYSPERGGAYYTEYQWSAWEFVDQTKEKSK
jgi:hypothetical protein